MGTADINGFATQVTAAPTFDAALDLLADEAGKLGFEGVDYAALPAARVLDGKWAIEPIFERNFPTGWRKGWRIRGRADPILPASYQKGLPIDWQLIRQQVPLANAQREALAFLDDLGFPGGITVPIHLPANRFAFVSAVSGLEGAQWAQMSARTMAPLMVLAHTFHHALAACGSRGRDPQVLLTPREIECLQFAANGATAPVTALALHRSVDTIRLHLKNAMAKLGARTIAQTVAIAAACGLVDVAAESMPVAAPGQGARPPKPT